MFARLDISVTFKNRKNREIGWSLEIGDIVDNDFGEGTIFADGFGIAIEANGVVLISQTPKGILNGVYELMEQLGYLYLLPGLDGEWVPEEIRELPEGLQIKNPRFPFRGIFREDVVAKDLYSAEGWIRFYAKLQFNALSFDREDLVPLAEELGIRMEIGGHGFSKLLPREEFDDNPELFRLFQPEDFKGKRLSDSNMCITNPVTKKIVKENFRKKVTECADVHAIHLWPDDLPAGGWCLCPSCRAFTPEDQAVLCMKTLSDVLDEEKSDLKLPVIAYHDTMTPGREIDVDKNMFLLFAPRERCYGHSLDDPNCKRNKFYLDALEQWMKKFDGIGDNHTFEYYCDQILFRGLYPFIPSIIIDDMRAYQSSGIECHQSLQVANQCISPEYNMLVFAKAHWDENISVNSFAAEFASKLETEHPKDGPLNPLMGLSNVWHDYLIQRSEIFTTALQMCDHNLNIYLDYRWLPESRDPFAEKMASIYLKSSKKLTALADKLAKYAETDNSKRVDTLVENEIKRLKFEAAEFVAMHYQQRAVNCFAEFQNSSNEDKKEEGIALMKSAITAMEESLEKALNFGLPEDGWYANNINKWLKKEFANKIEKYS